MIQNLRQRYLTIHYNYGNPVDNQQARGLFLISWIMLAAWAVWLSTLGIFDMIQGNFWEQPANFAGLIAPPLFGFLVVRMIQRGRLSYASWAFVAMLTISAYPTGGADGSTISVILIAMIGAGLMVNRPGFILVVAVLSAYQVIAVYNQYGTQFDFQVFGFNLLIMMVGAVLMIMFGTNVRRSMSRLFLETDELDATNLLGQQLKNVDSEEVALNRVIAVLSNHFAHTFAQVYLTDENRRLSRRLRAGLGTDQDSVMGEVTLAPSSAILEAARSQKRVTVALADSENRREHFLSSTRTAVEIPIILGLDLIGVLDVQNSEIAEYTPNQLAVLDMVANQVATTISYLRSAQDLREGMTEQLEVANNLRRQLTELRQSARVQVGSAWEEYLERRGVEAIGFDMPDSNTFRPANDLPDDIRLALERGEVTVEHVGDEQIMSVPIRMRGETVGAMSFALPADQIITDRQREVALNVADRLAQSLETKRLVEQTQEQALRERRANEAASLLLSSTDVNTVLDLAASAFNQALGAVHTQIYLRPGDIAEPTEPVGSEDK